MRKVGALNLLVLLTFLPAGSLLADSVVVSFDPAGRQVEAPIEPYVPFDLYFIGKGIDQLAAWELTMTVSPHYTVLEREVSNPPYIDWGAGEDGWVITFDGCRGEEGVDYLFVRYELAYVAGPVAPMDETVCVLRDTGREPPFTPYAAYVSCRNEIVPIELGIRNSCNRSLDGCAVLNPSEACAVGSKALSWSALKSAF